MLPTMYAPITRRSPPFESIEIGENVFTGNLTTFEIKGQGKVVIDSLYPS